MPVVEKVKRSPIEDAVPAPDEDTTIEKPRQRKQPTEAMKEAGRKNLEKGRLALQEKRKAAAGAKPPAAAKPVKAPPVDLVPNILL